MSGPFSSYSSFVIHIWSITESDPKIEPPSQAACFRSGGAWTSGDAPLGAQTRSSD
eukprot:CAMPEP_0182834002 /NCGR_PEP_ID=MMETSP0006_2-20121128/20648_1 /TAXON_ID=97485 /ORGANISM="Prymnesium parvum, Strain Texoma1" /LENGTH=55 /DNA_ID=CAMNT_0024962151 /DNA_START=347 /DNA_END=511 /DNA_ORIENTATION=-